MIQIDETRHQAQPQAAPLPRLAQDLQQDKQPNEANPDTGQAGEAGCDAPTFVSPPLAPFPRIFPGL